MKKLRLILWEDCERNCDGCCNKDWDIASLPISNDCRGYDEILLTGGEPLLRPLLLDVVIDRIRAQTDAKIYLYTAEPDRMLAWLLRKLDGTTVTLHEQSDVEKFREFQTILLDENVEGKSLRLNVFKGVDVTGISTDGWKVKDDMVWIKNCPLPEGEELKRLDLGKFDVRE